MIELSPRPPEPKTTEPNLDPDAAIVKDRLRLIRAELSLSQRDAAKKAGISKSVLEKYESREDVRIPNTRQLYRLAEAYAVSMDYLLGRTPVPTIAGTRSRGRARNTPPLQP